MIPPGLPVDLPEELKGPRVTVRPFRSGDGAAVFEAVAESREHILPWLPWGPSHLSVEDSELFAVRSAASWATRDDLTASIWSRDSGRFLGGTGLHRIRWEIP